MNKYEPSRFSYAGKQYQISITLYSKYNDVNIQPCSLDINDLIEVEWSSRFNELYLYGRVHYLDKYGKCDKFITQHFSLCDIKFTEFCYPSDGDISFEKESTTQNFEQAFLINNVRILNRQKQQIEYEFELVSINWLKLMANVNFSNFNKEKQSIFDIMKQCLENNNFEIESETFDEIKTDVKINYITNSNDNMFSVMRYLLNRQFYYEKREDHFKVIYYDYQNDKYGLFDFTKINSNVSTKSVTLSFFNSSEEEAVHSKEANFAVITKMPKTELYKKMFKNKVYDYQYDTDDINSNMISSENIIDFFNNSCENKKKDNIYKKYNFFADKILTFQNENAYWENDLTLYIDAIWMTFENNALVINTNGQINIKPGSLISIALDRSATLQNQVNGDIQNETDRYSSFEGSWIAVRVQNFVNVKKQQYTQNIVLFKNSVTLKEDAETI